MRARRRAVAIGAVLLGVAAIVLPAVAGSETTPTIEAVNVGGGIYGEEHHWSPAQATITAGGSVTLSNPSEVAHGVYWVGGPATPSCSSGVPVGTTAAASGTKWSGSCTFATPGVYTFYCTVHGPVMTGRVTVDAAGTTTVTTTNPAPGLGGAPGFGGEATTTSPQGAPGSPTASGSPLLGPASKALTLSSARHGAGVHGSIEISSAGVGGRLEVDLLVARRSLRDSSRTRAGSVRVGRFLRSSLPAGELSFTIPLTGEARDTLERQRHLRVSLQLIVTPSSGPPVRILRGLTLRHR